MTPRQLFRIVVFTALLTFGLAVAFLYPVYAIGEFVQCYNSVRHSSIYLAVDPDSSEILWECFKLHILWPLGYFL
jgi:hypothetical protein